MPKKAKNKRVHSSLARAKIKILRFKYLAFCTTISQTQLTPALRRINRIANSFHPFKHPTPSVKNETLYRVDLLALPRWVYKLPIAIKRMKDSIPSLESLGFTRSPFYFITYWTATRSSTLDLLGDHRPKYDAHSYVLFPEANAMKTAVFRKLTSQRLLAESRKPFLKQYAQKFYKKSFLAASSLTWEGKFSRRGLSINRASSSYMGFKNWLLTESVERYTQKYTPYIKPKRIRFKPGYGRMWRTARVSIREILDIKATYQYRLNSKLQTYYYQNRNQWKPERSLTIELVLMGAHYAPDRDAVYTLLTHNSVYLNGSTVSCNQLRIFTNDFIQLVVNLKFYITLRWLKSWAVVRQNRASKIFYRKYRPAPFNKNIRIVRELPRWFFDLESTYGDVPRCFEIDYFTLSAFVLPNTATAEEFTPTRSYMFDVNVLNMYNWKYIT